jgi:hypothetical protein
MEFRQQAALLPHRDAAVHLVKQTRCRLGIAGFGARLQLVVDFRQRRSRRGQGRGTGTARRRRPRLGIATFAFRSNLALSDARNLVVPRYAD